MLTQCTVLPRNLPIGAARVPAKESESRNSRLAGCLLLLLKSRNKNSPTTAMMHTLSPLTCAHICCVDELMLTSATHLIAEKKRDLLK